MGTWCKSVLPSPSVKQLTAIIHTGFTDGDQKMLEDVDKIAPKHKLSFSFTHIQA
jgi:hypothetical protein